MWKEKTILMTAMGAVLLAGSIMLSFSEGREEIEGAGLDSAGGPLPRIFASDDEQIDRSLRRLQNKPFSIGMQGTVHARNGSSTGKIAIPKTGQTRCYNASGTEVSCAGTGQDGEKQAGAAWPTPRFSDNGDGTLTDNLTGLVWLKNANCFGTQTWENALASVNALADGQCDLDDNSQAGEWRLPNINELESIVHGGENEETCGLYACASLAVWLEAQGFTDVKQNYWSSTTYVYPTLTNLAYFLDTTDSDVDASNKSNFRSVWAVRGGQTDEPDPAYPANVYKTGQTKCYNTAGTEISCAGTGQDGEKQAGVSWPDPRFTDNGNGTVTDSLTGLIWLKNADCPNAGGRNWTTALADVAQLNTDGTMNGNPCGDTSNAGDHQTDWRLPNRKELKSLANYGTHEPSLPAGHPFTGTSLTTGAAPYWTSSTDVDVMIAAWLVYMQNNEMLSNTKSNNGYVWAVRGGVTTFGLSISKQGAGSGTVTSSPAGIDCGTSCSASYAVGTEVTLTAQPDAGSTFENWEGDCSSCGSDATCMVLVTAQKHCVATFLLIQQDDADDSDDDETNLPDEDTVEPTDDATVVTDESVTDETVTDETVTDETVTDEVVAPDDAPVVTDDALPTDTDTTTPDADTTKPDTTADADAEQPDEETDEAVTDETGDGLFGDEDIIASPDEEKKSKDNGCGCSVVF